MTQYLINAVFIIGMAALLSGVYLEYGHGITLIVAGLIMVPLSIFAALKRGAPHVNPTV